MFGKKIEKPTSTLKVCPLMTEFGHDCMVFCNEDGRLIATLGPDDGDVMNLPCAGWKNGKCAFMHE